MIGECRSGPDKITRRVCYLLRGMQHSSEPCGPELSRP